MNLHMGCVGQIPKSGLGITPRDSKITILFGGGCPQIFLHTSALSTEAVCVLRPYLPDYPSVPMPLHFLLEGLIDAYSGNPEGDNTMLMMSLMREVFMTRSLGVVWDKEGEAFT